MCLFTGVLQLLLLACISQCLNAVPENLPFEVNLNSANTGLENDLMEQASKGDKFISNPKPADISQGFSFNSDPPTTTTLVESDPIKNTDTIVSSPKINRLPNQEVTTPATTITSSSPGMPDGSPGMLNRLFSRVGSSRFRMPSMNTNNMQLVEDRVIDDANGKGRIQTFTSKDGGTSVMQTMTYKLNPENNMVGGIQKTTSSISSTGQPTVSEVSTDQPSSLFSWPSLSRMVPTGLTATRPTLRFTY